MPKREWLLEWTEEVPLPEADYQILETYFLNNQACSFYWTHYATGIVYNVMIYQDDLTGDILVPGYRMTTVKLREI